MLLSLRPYRPVVKMGEYNDSCVIYRVLESVFGGFLEATQGRTDNTLGYGVLLLFCSVLIAFS